jgi:uncharacterized protein YlxW (UPF0749 family)
LTALRADVHIMFDSTRRIVTPGRALLQRGGAACVERERERVGLNEAERKGGSDMRPTASRMWRGILGLAIAGVWMTGCQNPDKQRIALLEEDNAKLLEEKAQKQKELDNVKGQMKRLAADAEAVKADAKQAADKAQADLAAANKAKADAEAQGKKLQDDLGAAKKAADDAKRAADKAQSDLAAAGKAKADTEAQMKNAQAELTKAKAEAKQAADEVKAAQAKVKSLEAELDRTKKALEAAQKEIESLKKKVKEGKQKVSSSTP